MAYRQQFGCRLTSTTVHHGLFLMPIPPKPSWHSIPTAIDSLPTGPSRNTFLESATNTPTTNCKDKPYDNNIENDRPDNDNNNNDDVDCFLQQDKQPMLPHTGYLTQRYHQ